MDTPQVNDTPYPPPLENEIETATAKFGVLDYAPVGFCLLRQDFTVLFWNRCLANWTHISSPQIVGSDLRHWFLSIDQPKYLMRLRQVFEGGFPTLFSPQLHQALIPCPLPDGENRVQKITVTAVPQKATTQPEYYALVAIQDLTDLTHQVQSYQTELRERQRAQAELQRSNAELEQFAYVASHDLREPLRMVTTFTQFLAEEYQGQLDQEANQMIEFAVDGASRMEALIGDLLTFSRVGRGADFEPTDLNAVLERVRDNLQIAISESGVVISQADLPTIQADSAQMVQLFQNLLSNAIKYHSDRPPQVHIGAERQQEHWLFSIQDNGIGIDPTHAKRIFLVFQRLHTQKQYPGTGIGLAICKKIVERHGGSIWVESELGKGATFYVKIPNQIPLGLPRIQPC